MGSESQLCQRHCPVRGPERNALKEIAEFLFECPDVFRCFMKWTLVLNSEILLVVLISDNGYWRNKATEEWAFYELMNCLGIYLDISWFPMTRDQRAIEPIAKAISSNVFSEIEFEHYRVPKRIIEFDHGVAQTQRSKLSLNRSSHKGEERFLIHADIKERAFEAFSHQQYKDLGSLVRRNKKCCWNWIVCCVSSRLRNK